MQDKSSASHGKITIRYVGLTSSRCIFICPNIMRAVPNVVDIFYAIKKFSTTGFYELWQNVYRHTIVTFFDELPNFIRCSYFLFKDIIFWSIPNHVTFYWTCLQEAMPIKGHKTVWPRDIIFTFKICSTLT